MASRDPIQLEMARIDTFEFDISDVTTPSDEQFDQPLSDFTVRFSNRVDTVSSHFTVMISVVRNKLQKGSFDASAELKCNHRTNGVHEDKQRFVSSQNCTLVVHSDYYPLNILAHVIVKISYVKPVLKTESAISENTDQVYARQKKFTKDLYDSRETTGDVTIVTAGGAKHKAHKLILGARSPFFKTVFEANLKERQESKVKIDKFEEDLVVGLIEFMYVGWTDTVKTKPKELFEIAHMYQVADLVKACRDALMKTLHVRNAIELLRWSCKFDDEGGSYKKEVGQFLFNNFGIIRKQPKFAAFVKEDVGLFLKICGMRL